MAELDRILDRSGDPATVAWAHDGQGDLAALPDPLLAILAAEKLGNAPALLAATGPKPVRKAAAAALHRLKSRGVKVDAPAPRAGVLGVEVIPVDTHAWLSFPDEEGEVKLLLGYSGPRGTRVLDIDLTGPHDAWAHAGPSSKNGIRDAGAELVREGGVPLPFAVALRYARTWAGGEKNVQEFSDHVGVELVAQADAVDPEAHLPPPGEDVPGHGWVYPADAFVGDGLDAAAQRLQERLAGLEVTDAPGLPPGVEEAFQDAGGVLLDHLTPRERQVLAEVARFGALVRRWHGAVGAAERLEAQATALEGDTPAREIPGMELAARRAVLVEALRAASGDDDGDDGDDEGEDFEDEEGEE